MHQKLAATVLVLAFPQPWVVVGQLFVVFDRMVYLMTEVVKLFRRTDFGVEAPAVVLKVCLVGV